MQLLQPKRGHGLDTTHVQYNLWTKAAKAWYQDVALKICAAHFATKYVPANLLPHLFSWGINFPWHCLKYLSICWLSTAIFSVLSFLKLFAVIENCHESQSSITMSPIKQQCPSTKSPIASFLTTNPPLSPLNPISLTYPATTNYTRHPPQTPSIPPTFYILAHYIGSRSKHK